VTFISPCTLRMVAPALEKYTQGTLLGDVWKRPGLSARAGRVGIRPRDRHLVRPSNTLPYAATMKKSPVPYSDYVGELAPVEPMQGVPLWKPPYSRITAIDLNTGDHRWMVPMAT